MCVCVCVGIRIEKNIIIIQFEREKKFSKAVVPLVKTNKQTKPKNALWK